MRAIANFSDVPQNSRALRHRISQPVPPAPRTNPLWALASGDRTVAATVVRFDSAHFRVWLANEMRRRRMSQRMLGERSGVDHSTISRLMSTGRTPSTETMVALATALGADLPGYLAPAPIQGSIDTRIRRALADLGVEPAVSDEMLAVYRRSQIRRSERDLTG